MIDAIENDKNIITLPLDFSEETEIPDNVKDFELIITGDKFRYGFKIYGKKIVPFSEEVGNKSIVLVANNVDKLFNNLFYDNFNNLYLFIIFIDGKYYFNVDKNLNTGSMMLDNGLSNPEGEVEKTKETIKYKFLYFLGIKQKLEESKFLIDPYITQYIKERLDEYSGFEGKDNSIKTIREFEKYFLIDFENSDSDGIFKKYKAVISKKNIGFIWVE